MSLITPKELTPGVARGQRLEGRVRMLSVSTNRSADVVELHLVVEAGVSGTIYIEAWREQARRLKDMLREGGMVRFTNLTIKAMGDKAQWQCTNLDVFGQVLQATRFENLPEDASCPADVHVVLIQDLPHYRKIPHLIHVGGLLVDIVTPATAKATAPAFNLVLGDVEKSVRLAVWKDHAGNIETGNFEKGSVVVVTSCRVSPGKEDTTDLGTSKRSRLQKPSETLQAAVLDRTAEPTALVSLSKLYTGVDYTSVKAIPIHLGALTSLIVAHETRDFQGEVYEVFHCLVDDLQPISQDDTIYYMGCPVCKKKASFPPQCQHTEEPVAHFLANCQIMTMECKASAKAIGSVLETLLQTPAANCILDAEGYSSNLESALDTLRGTPWNLRFIIGVTPAGDKNVLELVHALPTLNVATGAATFPSTGTRLVEQEISGVPPCEIRDLLEQNGFYTLHGRPVANLQVMLTITDSGDEHGAMERDGELVRLTRAALCCLSGLPVILHRSGDLGCMSKYIRWNKGDIIFMIVRILNNVDNTWHFAIKGSRKFQSEAAANVFNAYFAEYCSHAPSVGKMPPLSFEKAWTPKRRRQELSQDTSSQSELTPRNFSPTPVRFTQT